MKKRKIKSLIFDLDGTLVDSERSIVASYLDAFEYNNITPVVPITKEVVVGPSLVDGMNFLSKDNNVTPKLIDRFKLHYDLHGYKEVESFSCVDKMLSDLRSLDVKMYIATNKRDKPTNLIINNLKWVNFFTKIYSVDMNNQLFSSKSEMIESILKNENLEPDNVVYVGDTDDDEVAAKSSKVGFQFAYWGYK